MAHVRILVRHGGAWDEGRRKYEGGVLKGIVVPKEITHKDLQSELYDLAEVDPTKFDIKIRCIYEIKGEKEAPPFELSNDRDLKFYILSENPLEVPLYLSFEPTSNRSMKVLNKDYNSVSGSNQVQNLNPHPLIGMDTLDENEVDIGEVQVGLCDNMIGTNSAIWESYESYHSKDDTFTWESVEMYNELFDIPEQRDAPTKDCKGKGKVDYSSSSRKLKTKGSGWSEESSTSEELDFVVKKSTKEVLFVRCIDNKCGWRLRAVRLKDSNIFKIKKHVKVHSCSLEFLNRDHRQAKSWVVGELIKSKFKGPGRIYKPRNIIEDMRQDYDINMSYEKAWHARENAYERVRGSPEESYILLRRYDEALKFTNPGFLNCIRPVIVMDGTFLKNKYRNQLIVVVCLDGNNQIYPLAFGVVDRETDDSIQWFLEKLKGAIGEVPNLGFVTNRKTCFSKEVLRHLLAFPNGSGKYLNDVGIARWSRVHCPGRRYNMMTTNIAESMNSILKEPRDLPIASFLENVRALLQRWFWERREKGIKVTSTLTKWAELVIQKKQEGALTMKVNPIDCYQFHVKDLDKEEVVNLQTKEFTCKEFQAEQLPCSHVIAAARDRNINVYSLCANYYTNECLLVAYAEAVYPVGNQSDWKTSEDYVHMTVLPLKVVKRVGQPKKKRIPSVGEAPKLHKEHQQECGSDISIDDRDADLLMTIRDISDSLSAKIQKETDLPQMITTLPLVSQPLALCELASLDQTVQIVNEESQLTGINKPDCIVWNHIFDTHLVTPDNNKAEWTDPTAHLTIWTEKDVEYYFNTAVGDYDQIPGWGDVNYVISCINIKEYWLAIAADMRKCKIYVFDSMPNYVEQKLVDEALQMPTRCIASLVIAIGVNLHSDHFTYGSWPIRRSKATLQKGHSLDCEIFCSKFVECLVTGSDLGCLTVPNMKLFRQQYVLELWANKYFW
ncbi:MuDRA-like transposase [Cucumis melo var. makuwa]|uniref:MuDRA-like transposase n=1 Tax=Cucumis melo var. makuwa TaxID=1194695 RepID=A0A5A7TUG6_CUCMM|nr:MuDRA-like transposase [Cucumis melo var. makuwa]